MKKFFKITERIVIVITVLAIVGILALFIIGLIPKVDIDWHVFMPYIFIVAILISGYKAVVIFFGSLYKIQIVEREEVLNAMKGLQKNDNDILQHEENQNQKLDSIIEAVKQVPQVDTNAIVDIMKERLPEVVQGLVAQQVEAEKERLADEYKKRMSELDVVSAGVSDVLERRDYLLKLEEEIKQRKEEERKKRLEYTNEYTMLVFSLAGSSVEDVEKVCDAVKLFIQTGQMSGDKNLRIPLNKKLRNAELKQFAYNIIRYNQNESLDAESFLQTTFAEWFSGKKENIAKNYSQLPKDSLVSKEGVEVDLVNLRKQVGRKEDQESDKVQGADF